MPAAVLGFDPGRFGAVAVLSGDAVIVSPAPMVHRKRGRTKKPLTDLHQLRALVLTLSDVYEIRHAYVENVWGVRGQGASTGAALAHHRCAIESAMVWAGIPYTLVSPMRWKADLGLMHKDKAAALPLATATFPSIAETFAPKRGVRTKEVCVGLADAALIARWGQLYGAAHATNG